MPKNASLVTGSPAIRQSNTTEPVPQLLYSAICIAMLSSGTTSLFGIYGTGFSEFLNYTTYQTSFLITILEYSYHLSAPIFGYLSTKIGPKKCLRCSSLFLALGYVGLACLFSFKEFSLEYPSLSSFISAWLIILVGSGSKAVYMSCLSTTTFLYSKSSYVGVALSIPISMSGLSSFIFANLKTMFFGSKTTPTSFLFFLGVFNGVSTFFLSFYFFSGPLEEPTDSLQLLSTDGPRNYSLIIEPSSSEQSIHPVNINTDGTEARAPSEGFAKGRSFPTSPIGLFTVLYKRVLQSKLFLSSISLPDEYGFLTTPLFCIFLIGIAFCSGPEIMFINNSGLITKALANSPSNQLGPEEIEILKNDVVATFALCSFLGRIFSGFISDFFRIYLKAPTSFFLLIASMLMFRTQVLLGTLTSTNGVLSLSSLIGGALGLLFSLAPKLTTELWGHKNFGIAWGILSIGPALGSHICNIILASFWDLGASPSANKEPLGGLKSKLTELNNLALQCDYKCVKNVSGYTSRFGIVATVCFVVMLARHYMYKSTNSSPEL